MVEIFKTNVQTASDSLEVITQLYAAFPSYSINFDLEDCDRILRIEGDDIPCNTVAQCVSNLGFTCIALE